MELSKQVCTLEQAKRLKELGVIQESFFYHYQAFINSVEEFKIIPSQYAHYGSILNTECIERVISGEANNQFYSAFTVAELGEMLPHAIRGQYGEMILHLLAPNEGNEYNWTFVYLYPDQSMCSEPEIQYVDGETEAEARAQMLIFLLENSRITAEQVNASIT